MNRFHLMRTLRGIRSGVPAASFMQLTRACVLLTALMAFATVAQAQSRYLLPDPFTAAAFRKTVTEATGQTLLQHLNSSTQSGTFGNATYANSLDRYWHLSGSDRLGNLHLPEQIRNLILAELEKPSPTFSQLYVSEILMRQMQPASRFRESALFRMFTPDQQEAVLKFLDVRMFYNPETHDCGGRPNNYLGVALKLMAQNYHMGIEQDTATIRRLAHHCLSLLDSAGGHLDDNRQLMGAYDRYMHEFAMFIGESAELLGWPDLLKKTEPYVRASMALWADKLHPKRGFGSFYGRSLQNSWDDTFELAAFLAARPHLSPLKKNDLLSLFATAWNDYYRHQYDTATHQNKMLEPGRQTWSYAGRDRIVGYTVGTAGKLCRSAALLLEAMAPAPSESFRPAVSLPPVNRFAAFNRPDGQNFGIWLYRDSATCFHLPVVGNASNADYLPRPFGWDGFEGMVQKSYPALVPWWKTADGQTLQTAHAAEQVTFSPETRSLTLSYHALRDLKGKPSEGPGIQATCTWSWHGSGFTYHLNFTPETDMSLSGWELWLPTPNQTFHPETGRLDGDFPVVVAYQQTEGWPVTLQATPVTAAEGGGSFRPLSLLLKFTSGPFTAKAGTTYAFSLSVFEPTED